MRVRLAGLPIGRAHDYRVIVEAIDGAAETVETPWKSFRTLNPDAEAASFCVWNDTHENHQTIRRLQERTPKADFLLWNGDTCNDWHQQDRLVPTLLAPAGIDISEGHPLLMTLGNHDIRGKYAFRISEHVAMPDGRPYFAFRHGPLAVIGLNTGEDKPDEHPSFHGRVASQRHREEQAAWLREVITRPEMATAPHKVVFCHIPLRWLDELENVDYSGGGYDRFSRFSRDLWHDSLVAWGAQVVISGHTHQPASIPSNKDFPYAQITGGGPREDQACWIEGRTAADGLAISIRRTDNGEEIIREIFPKSAPTSKTGGNPIGH
jgi:predicted phosphodiesterase